MELVATVMDLKSDPASNWKAVRTVEQGLKHHHTPNSIFFKVFNNPDPLPCGDTVLPLAPTCKEFTKLGTPPSYDKVRAAIMRMANGKAPGPSGVTLEALQALV
eukprot:12526466-Ditylum_brightwellii.AAC.1